MLCTCVDNGKKAKPKLPWSAGRVSLVHFWLHLKLDLGWTIDRPPPGHLDKLGKMGGFFFLHYMAGQCTLEGVSIGLHPPFFGKMQLHLRPA